MNSLLLFLERVKTMNVKECITQIDEIKPNQFDNFVKIGWLNILDGQIETEILKAHEGYEGEFKPYSEDEPDRELLVAFPYDDIYISFLTMKIDEANAELARYNNSAATFNNKLDTYSKWYTRNHMPKGV